MTNCYAVFLKSNNKQIRVFSYSPLIPGDYSRAESLAFGLAKSNHESGHPCTVELFHMCDVGRQVLDTESQSN